jgi:very-short-patch-repair endonuclease
MKTRTSLARNLRSESTHAERKLWSRLRDRRFLGLKFKRQVPIDQFVVDFACVEAKLIIEVDGGQHDKGSAADRGRTEILESVGYLVLRFWNNDVLKNTDGVLEFIALTIKREALEPLTRRARARRPLPKGERVRLCNGY